MNYNIDKELLNKVNGSFTTTQEVGLPFWAPVLFVINGNVKAQQASSAMYFGGFATDKSSFDDGLAKENRTMPEVLERDSLVNQKGEMVEVYTSRHVLVSPVAKRSIWISPNGDRTNDYIKGSRNHVQILAVMGNKNGDNISIWGPVILSAKGYQARNLGNAFESWNKHTAVLRSTVAQGVPAWLFWTAVGTFGKQRMQEMVGASAKSPITPIVSFLPESMNEERLASVYGGETLANKIVELNKESEEWQKAWSGTLQKHESNATPNNTNSWSSKDAREDTEEEFPW